MKITKCIYVDAEIWMELQRLHPHQMSSKINEFLNNLLNVTKHNVKGFDLTKLRAEEKNREEIIVKANAELTQIRIDIESVNEKIKKEEGKKMDREEREAMKLVTCDVCGFPKLAEKIHDMPKGKVCNTCYFAADPSTLKKYLSEDSSK